MSLEFKNLLTDILSKVEPFSDGVSHILMRKEGDGGIAFLAKSRDGNISITGTSKEIIPFFEDVACLGSLPYLGSVLNSAYFKKGNDLNMELNYETSSNGKTRALRSILFTTKNGKFESFYQATDPFVHNLNKNKPSVIDNWPIEFTINKGVIAEFTEVAKIHKSAPKIGGDRDDIFTLAYSSEKILAIFGEKGHQSTVILAEDVDYSGVTDSLSALFSLTTVQSLFKLIGKSDAVCRVADKALKIELETINGFYFFVTTAKKLSI